MDANALLYYLRGFFETVPQPTQEQITAIRNEILRAQPAGPVTPFQLHGDCEGCRKKVPH